MILVKADLQGGEATLLLTVRFLSRLLVATHQASPMLLSRGLSTDKGGCGAAIRIKSSKPIDVLWLCWRARRHPEVAHNPLCFQGSKGFYCPSTGHGINIKLANLNKEVRHNKKVHCSSECP